MVQTADPGYFHSTARRFPSDRLGPKKYMCLHNQRIYQWRFQDLICVWGDGLCQREGDWKYKYVLVCFGHISIKIWFKGNRERSKRKHFAFEAETNHGSAAVKGVHMYGSASVHMYAKKTVHVYRPESVSFCHYIYATHVFKLKAAKCVRGNLDWLSITAGGGKW